MPRKDKSINCTRSNLIGTIHTLRGFAEAKIAPIDAAEVRVDALPKIPGAELIASAGKPMVLTARRSDEGGCRPWADAERRAIYLDLLPVVAAIDVEARSVKSLGKVIEAAKAQRRTVIVSFHDFKKTPTVAKLRDIAARARDGGADVVKIAAFLEGPAAAGRLLELMERVSGPLAVMGMGPLGRASRLLFAKAGSVLNYGWLDRAFVPGQWSAREFRGILDRA